MIEIISGEKFTFLCDHILGDEKDFTFSPKDIKQLYPEKLIYFHNLNEEFDNKELIFVYGSKLKNIDFLIDKLSYLKNNFKLIIHNSDNSFDNNHLVLFNKITKLQKVFSQNVDVTNEKVIPIPIGLSNRQWSFGDIPTLYDVLNKNNKKDKIIYANFTIQTNREKRKICYDIIKKKNIKILPTTTFKKNLEILSHYKFCISPEGNGLDCHRTWESLWLRTIPICFRSPGIEYFKSIGLPIIILDDWNDINIEYLNNEYKNINWDSVLNLCDFNYWKKIIYQ